MRYEPGGYIIEYEISAMVFLAVVMVRYFGARRFPNQKNRLFAVVLWLTLSDMSLDVVSSLIIDNVFLVHPVVTYVVNEVFYLMQILMPLLMALYALAMKAPLNRRRLLRLSPLFLPELVMTVIMVTNPLTHWIFYIDPVAGYIHGSLFIYTYIVCFFYMGVTLVTAVSIRASLRPIEFTTICSFLAIVLVSIFIQFMIPELLISGVAMALAVILMYFTIQNPESMLDATSGAFTYEAMLAFLRDRMQENDRIQLVAVEIRNMHRINELLGVERGSRLLAQISEFLLTRANNPWVFRMRDGCFVVITQRSEDYEAIRLQLEARMNHAWTVGNSEILIQATICCAPVGELLDGPISPKEAVDYLETAFLQQGDAESRVRTVTVGPELLRAVNRSQTVEAALREAVETGEGLELYFQPLWSPAQERFVSAEVLLRFHHPVLGEISPAEFVPIAESNGLVTMLDELVLRKSCAFIRDNDPKRTLGLDAVEINLSALEFMNRRLPELLDEIMDQYEIDPGFLYLEITETAATESFELLRESMLALCRKGCRFALDDFGTGYANISQVIRLPFSMVKLDRSLLLGPEMVLEDMARMFKRMKLTTVLEGVESPIQAALAQSIRIDFIQGFYYARPMCERDFIAFLQKQLAEAPTAPAFEA